MNKPRVTHLYITADNVVYGLYNARPGKLVDVRAEDYCVFVYGAGVPGFESMLSNKWTGLSGGFVDGKLVTL